MARITNAVNRQRGSDHLMHLRPWPLTGGRLAAIFVAIYALVFPLCFSLLTWYGIPQTSFASMTNHNGWAAIGLALVGLVLILLCRQMWLVALHESGRPVIIAVFVGWLAASLSLLFTYPGQSTDMGDYSFHAHMLVHLGQNPLTTPPSAVIPFEAYPYLAWYRVVDPYGPLWIGLAGGLHALVGDEVLANFLGFKVLAMLATGVCGFFIYAILRRIARPYAVAGLVLWLWNPLVLNEGVLNGHNDLVTVAVMLAGLWFITREHVTLGVITLIVAGLFKVHAWLVLPVIGVWLLRQLGWRRTLISLVPAMLVGGLLVWLSYAPFGGWMLLLDFVKERGWWPTGTWTAAAFYSLRDGLSWPHDAVVSQVIGGATLVFVLVSLILLVKIRDWRVCAWSVVLAYLLIAAHWFQPWYATALIALAAIATDRRVVAYTWVFTFFMLLHPLVAQYVTPLIHLPPGGYDLVMAATTLLVPQVLALCLLVMSKKRGLKPALIIT